MKWKDFLHYQRGSRLAVILLLILILLTMILNGVLRYGRRSEMVIVQNEELIREFDSFRQTLRKRESPSLVRNRHEGNAGYATESKTFGEKAIRSEGDRAAGFTPFPTTEKLSVGETISLNETDTTQWKKIPGIGSSYASRIVKYRELLGGYVRPEQLLEVYGMDNERYGRIVPYIEIDIHIKRLKINELEFRELLRHPYLNYKQVQAIVSLRRRKGDIVSIAELSMLDEFTKDDIDRLAPYLEF
ncbi:MAG: hypothetical protein A2W86_05940 [Bacteroidetes bacterium GWD2_45_23]|nr:MAG: hypothetical protein A2W87_13175 [Bacteroidetes bacterium GWC2_46_850]OFX74233.1 MAG: hypothetical protein A2071_03210 [Bacteroidetes bacterium GWC1_47_7]OFX87693.1 MAG: hypothetical protein A2W86_05940 [Bacteroidetes bacterium GWD2_45_23]HAR39107.1 hypothetical protein [Porphyromonadaceae bacterium]HBB01332.1 hypothetical protein [Porphyromonadaceae bacterium]